MVDPAVPTTVIVGVDIGMTCTGVAVWSDVSPPIPVAIQKWPMGDYAQPTIVTNKVPTKIAYKAGMSAGGIHSWGFQCPPVEKIGPAMAVEDMFKFLLDRQYFREKYEGRYEKAPGTVEDVMGWYTDFLYKLHVHVTTILEEKWKVDPMVTEVEYNFSIPTSWADNDRMIHLFRSIVEAAGFGTGNETIHMKLTEAEASAVFTVKVRESAFKEGDVFIVVDAGGATTDMGSMQVKKVTNEAVELDNLNQPTAIPVGSLNIDDLFEKKADEVLNALRPRYPHLPHYRAHQITKSRFQGIKLACGTPRSLPVMTFGVSGTSDTGEESGEPILSEKIVLTDDELKAMFDEQLEQIFKFIDKEIEYLQWYIRDKRLSYLILAGGLASSQYFQDKMNQRYSHVGVLCAPEPEDLPLSVCKGLVIDRLQNLSSQASVINIESSRASYGILYSEPHSAHHQGQSPVKHTVDGNKYVENQIDWLIKGGRTMNMGNIVTRYYRIVGQEGKVGGWRFGVVKSQLPLARLPNSLKETSVTVICWIVCEGTDVRHMPAVIPKRGLLGRKKKEKYSVVEYDLLSVVELGKLRFEARVFGQGRFQPLKIQWPDEEPKEVKEEGATFEDGLFRNAADPATV